MFLEPKSMAIFKYLWLITCELQRYLKKTDRDLHMNSWLLFFLCGKKLLKNLNTQLLFNCILFFTFSAKTLSYKVNLLLAFS